MAGQRRTGTKVGRVRLATSPLFLVVGIACADSDVPVCTPLVDGVDVVENRGRGIWSEQGKTPALVELWRAGGLVEGEELGVPIAIAPGPGGRIAIPDFQLTEVIGIAGDGTWLGTLTRNGPGPGEVRQPVAAAWTEAGHLVAFDIAGSKVVFLREDGLPARSELPVTGAVTAPIRSSGGFRGALVTPDGTVLVLPKAEPPPGPEDAQPEATTSVLRARPNAEAADTLLQVRAPAVTPEGWQPLVATGHPHALAAVGPDGVVALGSTDGRYRVLLETLTGEPLRQVCRPAPPLPLDGRERGELAADPDDPLSAAMRASPPPDTLAAYGRLLVGRGGVLWVQRERESAFGGGDAGIESIHGVAGATHDVFDETGRYLGAVRAPDGSYIQAVAGDTVWAFAFGSLDEVSVVAYRLELR